MNKLYFNSRDELICIDINLVAAVQADGNYSKIIYVTQKEIILSHGISKVEEALKLCNDSRNTFVRLGRSVVINQAYFQKIDLLKGLLILGDTSKNEIKLNLPKLILKTYKEAILKKIEIQENKKYARSY